MKPVAWIGADPGMSGALALLIPLAVEIPGGALRAQVQVEDMPAHVVDGKRRMDFWKLAAILKAWSEAYDIRGVTIERVNAMPGQGVSSCFSFGGAFYALQQAVASAGLPLTLIHPATWKAVYGLRGGRENKDMSRQKASQFYPGFAHLWARKKDDGRAEAVLLARYGSQLRSA